MSRPPALSAAGIGRRPAQRALSVDSSGAPDHGPGIDGQHAVVGMYDAGDGIDGRAAEARTVERNVQRSAAAARRSPSSRAR